MMPLDLLFPPRADEVVLRDVRPEDFVALMEPRVVIDSTHRIAALLPFTDKRVRSALHEAKYRGSEEALNLLAHTLRTFLQDLDASERVTLIPVPLGRERHAERGFNQVEEVARRALKGLSIPIDTRLLARMRDTKSQISLPRKLREENMRGAFGAARLAQTEHTYLILDDVVTTGATLSAACEALLDAGATRVVPLALAH